MVKYIIKLWVSNGVFFIHAVFHEINGDTFAFSVNDNDSTFVECNNFKPNMGVYNSFTELLLGVTNLYYKFWNH